MSIVNKNISSSAAIAWSKINASTAIAAGDIGSSQVLDRHLSGNLRTGWIPLDFSRARVVSSTSGEAFSSGNAGYLSSATAPIYDVVSTAIRAQRTVWSSALATTIQFPNVVMPPDYSTANSSASIHVLGNSNGSTDAGPGFLFSIFASTGSSAAPIEVTMSSAAASTVAHEASTTIPVAQMVAHPGVMSVVMGVKSTADVLSAYSVWLEYKRNSTA